MNGLYLEAAPYLLISFLTPFAELLNGEATITPRAIAAAAVAGSILAATALRAFQSTSYSRATADAILVRDSGAGASAPLLHENKTLTP